MAQNVEAVSRERPWIFQVTTSVVHLADVVALFHRVTRAIQNRSLFILTF